MQLAEAGGDCNRTNRSGADTTGLSVEEGTVEASQATKKVWEPLLLPLVPSDEGHHHPE